MRIFELERDGYYYTIRINDVEIATERYTSEYKAIEWANAYISSFDCSSLKLNFIRKPSMEELYE